MKNYFLPALCKIEVIFFVKIELLKIFGSWILDTRYQILKQLVTGNRKPVAKPETKRAAIIHCPSVFREDKKKNGLLNKPKLVF